MRLMRAGPLFLFGAAAQVSSPPPYGATDGQSRRFPRPADARIAARLALPDSGPPLSSARPIHEESSPLFRRSKTAEATATSETLKVGGKGRPTPSRKEAQAAARARAKGPQDKKGASRAQREHRTREQRHDPRGHEARRRALPADPRQGPGAPVRPRLDRRPALHGRDAAAPAADHPGRPGLLAGSRQRAVERDHPAGRPRHVAGASSGCVASCAAGSPTQSTKGAVGYGVLRSIQLRWIRLPKAQVKLGQKLPDRY